MRPDQTPMPAHVLVFAPYIEQDGKLVSTHYDLPEYRAEIDAWMNALGIIWQWRAVTRSNLEAELINASQVLTGGNGVVFNLCDGTEADGYPGIEVVEGLERHAIAYTGADPAFYRNTTSKAVSKAMFAAAGVASAPSFLLVDGAVNIDKAIEAVGFPLFIKPDVSAGSYGIQVDSVCYDRAGGCAKNRSADAWVAWPAFREERNSG